MKQYSSRILKTIAALYVGFPVSYLVLAAILFNISAENGIKLLLTPFYWMLSTFAVIAGVGLWEMRRWSWYVFAVTNVFVIYENAVVLSEYSAAFHGAIAFLISASVLAAVTYQVAREIRVPYFFPRIRWWESNPRYRLSVPVVMRRKDGSVIEGDILDISVGGCFVKLHSDLLQDESLSLNFSFYDMPISCNGIVVWRTHSTVTHPKGIGIKFEPLNRTDRRSLRIVSRRLKQISILYRKSRYLLAPEEFQKQFERLERYDPPSRLSGLSSSIKRAKE